MVETNETFFDLELCEKLASGGMAEVFRAKQHGIGGFEKIVAVKRILPSFAADQEFRSMFQFEMNLAARLQHPNIAQIFKNGEAEDFVYLVMEYIDGKNLRELFELARDDNFDVPISIGCFIMLEAAKGLDYAHNFVDDNTEEKIGLIHRDISPQNIMLSYNGHVKIVDFGVAKASRASGGTKAGVLKGKFSYMSPEQVRGETIDHRSDIFSLGIVFFELMTRQRLFSKDDEMETLRAVNDCKIPPPHEFNPKIDPEMEQILLKMLAKDRNARYQSAKDLVRALTGYVNKKFPDFIPMDLADYLKEVFAKHINQEKSGREKYTTSVSNSSSVSRKISLNSVSSVRSGMSFNVVQVPFYKSPVKLGLLAVFVAFIIGVTVTLGILLKRSSTWSSGLAGAIASPREVKGLAAWFVADSINIGHEQEGISNWLGMSERAFSAKQNIKAFQPKVVKNRLNGLAVLKCDGVDDYLEADELAEELRKVEELTVFYVAKPHADTTHYVFALNAKDRDLTIVRGGFYKGKRLRIKATRTSADYFHSAPVDIDTFSIYGVVFEKDYARLFQDGFLRIFARIPQRVNYKDAAFFSICQEWDKEGPSDFFNGEIAEILVYNRGLPSVERQAVEGYLSKKYALKIKEK